MTNKYIILTEKFFNEPPVSLEPTYSKSSVYTYDSAKHGKNLETFKKHPDFAAFSNYYFQLLDSLDALKNKTVMTVDQKEIFQEYINTFKEKHLFNPLYCDARTHALWNVTRKHIETLVEILPTANLSTSEKTDLLNELAPNLLFCVDGIISHLQDILKKISINQYSVIAYAKEILCEQLILEFIRDCHTKQQSAMEVHYVNAFINQLAPKFGLARRPHEQTVTDKNSLVQDHYSACLDYLLEKLPFALIDYLIKQLKSTAKQALKDSPTFPQLFFLEQPIAQFFGNNSFVHVLFKDSGERNPSLLIATELLPLQVADACQHQGWLHLPKWQLLAQLSGDGDLYGLVTPQPWPLIWWQPWPKAPYETWKLPEAVQLSKYLQYSNPCQPLLDFACQRLISTDITLFLQLLLKKPTMYSNLSQQTIHNLHKTLSHAKSIPSNFQTELSDDRELLELFSNFIPSNFNMELSDDQELVELFVNYPQTAFRLLQRQQLRLLQRQHLRLLNQKIVSTLITPEIVLKKLSNNQGYKLPEILFLDLIDQSVNLNVRDFCGSLLLIQAITNRQFLLVRRLLQFSNLNINYQNPPNGRSALIAAVLVDPYQPELVNDLLRYPKIKLEIKDNQGKSAIDYARISNNRLAIHTLENHFSALPLSVPVLIDQISCFIQQEVLNISRCPLIQQLRSCYLHWCSF